MGKTPLQRKIEYFATSMDQFEPIESGLIQREMTERKRLDRWFDFASLSRPTREYFLGNTEILPYLPGDVCNSCFQEGTLKIVA